MKQTIVVEYECAVGNKAEGAAAIGTVASWSPEQRACIELMDALPEDAWALLADVLRGLAVKGMPAMVEERVRRIQPEPEPAQRVWKAGTVPPVVFVGMRLRHPFHSDAVTVVAETAPNMWDYDGVGLVGHGDVRRWPLAEDFPIPEDA